MTWGEPGFSQLILGALLGVLTLGWILLVVGVKNWGRGWRLDLSARPSVEPLISICIPARDEEGNIGNAVRAALAQEYSALEVIVLNDGSSDNTEAEAIQAASGDSRFRLINGSEPPQGWAGKPWACQRLGQESQGEYLLFIDADVVLDPQALAASMVVVVERKLDLMSLFGDWKLDSFWEGAVIPVVGWLIRGTVDFDAVNSQSSSQAFANGQFILVDRSVWKQVRGHELVKSAVLEDVWLARAFKQRALKTGLYHGRGAFSVRLYRSLSEIIAGYRKNLYEGMGRSPSVGCASVIFVFVGTIVPVITFPVLAIGSIIGALSVPYFWLWWSALLMALVPIFRFRIERMDGRSGWHALTHPIGNLVLAWILISSMFSYRVEWKGRSFTDGRAE